MALRVFVSSVIEGFEVYREAARKGIVATGGEPVLVNEDFPARDVSPRNACLEAVASCDVYLGILGGRAGFEAPSGRSVVEEEYEEAMRCQLPVFVFIQKTDRERRQQEMVDRLSDFVDGRYRIEFDGPGELEGKVRSALEGMLSTATIRANLAMVDAQPNTCTIVCHGSDGLKDGVAAASRPAGAGP